MNCWPVACSLRVAVNGEVAGILCEAAIRDEDPALLDRDRDAEAEATRAVEAAGRMRGPAALSAGNELVRDRQAAMMTVYIPRGD